MYSKVKVRLFHGLGCAELHLSSAMLFCNSAFTKHIQEFKLLFSIFSFVVIIITVKSECWCKKYIYL